MRDAGSPCDLNNFKLGTANYATKEELPLAEKVFLPRRLRQKLMEGQLLSFICVNDIHIMKR